MEGEGGSQLPGRSITHPGKAGIGANARDCGRAGHMLGASLSPNPDSIWWIVISTPSLASLERKLHPSHPESLSMDQKNGICLSTRYIRMSCLLAGWQCDELQPLESDDRLPLLVK